MEFGMELNANHPRVIRDFDEHGCPLWTEEMIVGALDGWRPPSSPPTAEWKPGDQVIVCQNDAPQRAVVVKVGASPTKLRPGVRIDVDKGEGPEGIASYLLVRDPNPPSVGELLA